MYKQRPVRDAKGKVLFEQYQSATAPNTRIVPDRRWFGNTRVVGQAALEAFRNDMAAKSNDAYNVVLKQKTLPLALLEEGGSKGKRQAGAGGAGGGADTAMLPRSHVLSAQPFASTDTAVRRKMSLACQPSGPISFHQSRKRGGQFSSARCRRRSLERSTLLGMSWL